MIYYGPKELAASFRQVRGNTIQIAQDIPEDKYDFRPAADSRSVAQALVHISYGPAVQMYLHQNRLTDLQPVNWGQVFAPLAAEEAKRRTKAEIIALLKSKGEEFATYLGGLTEGFLGESVKMPEGAQPTTKSRFEMLLSPKEHEMHHRAQLMVAQRMLGLVPHLTRQMQERMAQSAAGTAAR